MEGADIEARTEPLLGAMAEIKNLELADLIAEPLSRPRDVAINFSLDGRFVSGAALAEIGHGLFAGPTFGVNSGVDDQTNRAHQFEIEAPIIRGRILKKPDLLTEGLGINRPAFCVGIIDDVEAKLGQTGQALLDGDLQVMAGDAFVVGLGLVAEQFSMGVVGSCNHDSRRPAPSGVPKT